jgi:hypothetical protein
MEKVIPGIVQSKFKEYEQSRSNLVRSLRVLYEGGLIGKRKYTSIRNSGDIIKSSESNKKNEVFPKCMQPKIVPYKKLMKYVNSIDIGNVNDLQDLATLYSMEPVNGVYRPLRPFLLRLVDLYLDVDKVNPCMSWLNGKENVIHVAVGADGAPFGKDDTATGIFLKCVVNKFPL